MRRTPAPKAGVRRLLLHDDAPRPRGRSSHGYRALVLGAWGCGAFGSDPWRTARDFRHALEDEFTHVFDEVVFAITDWSPE